MRSPVPTTALGLAAIALISAASPAAVGAAGPASADRTRAACRYGATVVAALDANTLLDDRPVTPSDRLGPKDDPVVQAWRARGPSNLFAACPELRRRLPAGVRFATPQDHADAAQIPSARSVFITAFAAPFVSADGKQLIHAQTWKCPGLCGGYSILRARREGKGWSKPEIIGMAIS